MLACQSEYFSRCRNSAPRYRGVYYIGSRIPRVEMGREGARQRVENILGRLVSNQLGLNFLQVMYDWSYNHSIRYASRDVMSTIIPRHYINVYSLRPNLHSMITPKQLMVDVLQHSMIHHSNSERSINRFIEVASKCRCFGLNLNGASDPTEPIHFLRYRYNVTFDKGDKEIQMFHFISKALTCMGCDITTCCGQKCGYQGTLFMSKHTHTCPFLLGFQRLNSFEVELLFRETCYYLRKDIIDLDVDEYAPHFNMTAAVLNPTSPRWLSTTVGSRLQTHIIDMQNLLRFNVYFDSNTRLREPVKRIVDRFGIARYCTLCRNEECHMFSRCIVHSHYHAETNSHNGRGGNNLCYVRESIDRLHPIEIENYLSSTFTEEEVEEIQTDILSEQVTHASQYYVTDSETEIEVETEEETEEEDNNTQDPEYIPNEDEDDED